MALSGRAGLLDALKDTYINTELLEGANQYYCSYCKQLVDAKRVSVVYINMTYIHMHSHRWVGGSASTHRGKLLICVAHEHHKNQYAQGCDGVKMTANWFALQ